MMTMMLPIKLIILCVVLNSIHLISAQSLFQKCDKDRDFQLNKSEFVQCFHSDSPYDDEGFEALFDHLDSNGDGSITAKEYSKAQETLFKPKSFGGVDEDTVTFTDRSGKTREVPLKSVYKAMEENMKGFKRTDDNKLMKEEEKTSKVSDLSKTDPQIDSIVKIGNWTFHRLRDFQIVGPNSQLKSMLSDGMKYFTRSADKEFFPNYSSQRSAVLNVTLRTEQENSKDEFKITVHYDPVAYDVPHLALLLVYKLVENKELSLTIPEPTVRDWHSLRKSVIRRIWDKLRHSPMLLSMICLAWIVLGLMSYYIFFYHSDVRRNSTLLPDNDDDNDRVARVNDATTDVDNKSKVE